MKRNCLNTVVFCLGLLAALFTSCTNNGSSDHQGKTIDSLQKELRKFKEEKAMTEARLRRFDSLDFDFYSKQMWDSFAISHDKNIKVYYPDGSITEGLFPKHIDMLTPTFSFAPDTKIKSHPVRFGSGDWTCVIGEMEGTFSKAMSMNGKVIKPTNKKFKLMMVTVGHWKGDKMIEEYLFWDNQAFMTQIGLGK